MKARYSAPSKPNGFSLFEVLLVVCFLGIMIAIVVPSMTNGNQYEATRNRRNAQEMSAVCGSAQVAGLNLVVPGDVVATIRNIITGGSPSEGPFKGKKFGVLGIKEADALKAASYLHLHGTSLQYEPGSM